jgi:hypothetical protein
LLLAIASDVYPTTSAEEMTLILTGREAQAVAMMEGRRDQDAPRVDDVEDFRLEPTGDLFAGVYEVFVEQGSTELRNPVMREQKYREMFMALVNTFPALQQAGVPVNLRKALEMWYEAAGIDDIDAMFEPSGPPPGMGPGMGGDPGMEGLGGLPPELLQALAAAGGGQEGPAGGMPPVSPPGPPLGMIDPDNSGMMPPIS